MANIENEHSDSTFNKRLALVESLRKMNPEDRAKGLFNPKTVSVLLDREIETLEKDRSKQRKAIKGETPIKKSSYSSISYIPAESVGGEIKYTANALIRFLDDLAETETRPLLMRGQDASKDPKSRGFTSWLSYGSPADIWPFCIQADGRPLPFEEAVATGRITDDVEGLNIRSFAERIADAASRSFTDKEANIFDEISSPGTPVRTTTSMDGKRLRRENDGSL
jgi:hypothetical protein